MARSLFETRVKLRTFDHIFAFCRHLFLDGPAYSIHSELVNFLQLCHGLTQQAPTEYFQNLHHCKGIEERKEVVAKKSWSTGANKATTETAS